MPAVRWRNPPASPPPSWLGSVCWNTPRSLSSRSRPAPAPRSARRWRPPGSPARAPERADAAGRARAAAGRAPACRLRTQPPSCRYSSACLGLRVYSKSEAAPQTPNTKSIRCPVPKQNWRRNLQSSRYYDKYSYRGEAEIFISFHGSHALWEGRHSYMPLIEQEAGFVPRGRSVFFYLQ